LMWTFTKESDISSIQKGLVRKIRPRP
jgi:hypothetical protein